MMAVMNRNDVNRKTWYLLILMPIIYLAVSVLVEAAEVIPMERILLETDCPYLAPVPNRGKRNDSSNIRYVIEKLAEIKKMSYDEIVDITNNNARRLFFKEA
jgi:TatD DNase family protein